MEGEDSYLRIIVKATLHRQQNSFKLLNNTGTLTK